MSHLSARSLVFILSVAVLSAALFAGSLLAAGDSVQSLAVSDSSTLPSFSASTTIDHPYMPLSSLRRVVLEGEDEGRTLRIETTLMPDTRRIEWAGGTIEAVVVQDVVFADGEVVEVTYDYFAQADDGSVYYLGEDVTNYENGRVTDHDGTWLAGREGAQPSLIMPAAPAVGMIYHPENLPAVAYETNVVVSLTEKTQTPEGTIAHGMLVRETMMDGVAVEFKVFAPGFGLVEEWGTDSHLRITSVEPVSEASPFVDADLEYVIALKAEFMRNVQQGNYDAAARNVIAINAVWTRVRPFVQPYVGAQYVYDFETSVTKAWAKVIEQTQMEKAPQAPSQPDSSEPLKPVRSGKLG